jgi:hypothetical protein
MRLPHIYFESLESSGPLFVVFCLWFGGVERRLMIVKSEGSIDKTWKGQHTGRKRVDINIVKGI